MNHKSLGLLALTMLSLIAQSAPGADWPQWRGPNGDAISKETGLLATWPAEGPKQLWEAPLGLGYSSMAVADGRVLTMFQDETGQYVAAFDEASGKPLWKTTTGAGFQDPTRRHGPRATPTVEGDFVYAIDGNGVLICLKAADGKEVWKKNLLELAGAENIQWGIAQSPFISGDLVLANPGGSNNAAFVALNKKSGEVVWKSGNGIAGYSTPVKFKSGGVDQFVFLTGDGVTGVAAKDGKVLWTHPWKTSYDVNAANPIVLDDMIFISSGYQHGAAVLKVDPTQTPPVKELWQSKVLQCHFNTPILMDGLLYGYCEQKLACVDFKTGTLKWQDEARAMPPKAHLTYADKLFYLLGENGMLTLARLDAAKFEKVSEVRIFQGRERWAAPVVANGRLYVRDDKKLVCLDIKAR